MKSNSPWKNIGCYPTPHSLAEEFASEVTRHLKKDYNSKSKTHDLLATDIFAGDGRLGESVIKQVEPHFKKVKATFVEVDSSRLKENGINNAEKIYTNVFDWNPKSKFDLVISNPPYCKLNKSRAEELGLSWEESKDAACNLYGLGISKGLDLCREGGLLAVIAPFSWLRCVSSEDFRDLLYTQCSSIHIKANDNRSLFEDIHQDVAIQLFQKKTTVSKKKAYVYFNYNGDKPAKFNGDYIETRKVKCDKNELAEVRVGSIVWNQKKEYLGSSKKASRFLVYGGNISHEGELEVDVPKYMHKQYIKRSVLNKSDILKAPAILLRRTMRGRPGEWKIDSCIIKEKYECVVENHVIVVELSPSFKNVNKFYRELMKRIREYYYYSGTPSISTKVVNIITKDILKQS